MSFLPTFDTPKCIESSVQHETRDKLEESKRENREVERQVRIEPAQRVSVLSLHFADSANFAQFFALCV